MINAQAGIPRLTKDIPVEGVGFTTYCITSTILLNIVGYIVQIVYMPVARAVLLRMYITAEAWFQRSNTVRHLPHQEKDNNTITLVATRAFR
jgi:hypothetical protein